MNGDWLCPRCGDLQFARNLQCRICGTARPPFGGQGGVPCYEDGSFDGRGGFGAPPYGGSNGGYPQPQYPGSLPYTGAPSYPSGPFGAYPGPNGRGHFGRPPRGRGFQGGGVFGAFPSAHGGKGSRGSMPPRANALNGGHAAASGAAGSGGAAATQPGSEERGAAGSDFAQFDGDASNHSPVQPENGGSAVEEDDGGAEAVVVESLECPHHLAGAVIGRHGSAIAQLRRETRCHIEIEASPGNGAPRVVTVCGPRAAVQDAVSQIKGILNERLASAENGEGHYGPGGRVASDEDRQRTSRLIDTLEARGVLRRSWLDERCMEVLMMLPFDITGRVLHEAERVDLWKTRNVSAFLMMLVKTVQHTPDRRDGGSDRMSHRQHMGAPQRSPHGFMRNEGSQNWGSPQAGFAIYGPSTSYLAVPWTPGSYQQAYTGYQEYQVPYDSSYMSSYDAPPSPGPTAIISAPGSPAGGFAVAPSFGVVGGTWNPANGSPEGGAIAVPVAAAGMGFEYGGNLVPVAVVPASPQHCPQVQPDTFVSVGDMDQLLQLPSPQKYPDIRERDGTQTPSVHSEIGDVNEALLTIYSGDMP